jgi:hypothetical protein
LLRDGRWMRDDLSDMLMVAVEIIEVEQAEMKFLSPKERCPAIERYE